MQPPIGTSVEKAASKQPSSSPSRPGSPLLVHGPPSEATLLQYSKCPISSEKATLYECAAHGTRVCSLEVAYIGWKLYGVCEQVTAAGWKLTCAKPLAELAVIEPVAPVDVSLMLVTRPEKESWMSTSRLSPEFMNRLVEGLCVIAENVCDHVTCGYRELPELLSDT